MAHWTDIFTLETWAQAEATGFTVSGFPPPTPGKGGYSTGLFERVKAGDVLLCYCKKPAARWVGALRVKSATFESDEPVWGLDESGKARFPWRYEVEPIVTLDPARGVPGQDVAAELPFLKRFKSWGVYLQRSLNPIPDEDGEALLALLREPRSPVPIHVPARRPGHPRTKPEADAPERTLLDAHAVTLELAPPLAGDEAPERESRVHTEIQGKLRDIGIFEGYDVWVADRGLEWEDGVLGDGCLTDLPVVAPERTRVVMRSIDVIWFRRGAGHPIRFFEIENSTSVYSGLLRFNDVMIDFPIPEAFIIGDGEKTQRRFEREISRRTFEQSGLKDVTKFLLYDQVRQTWQRYQTVGAGSKAWGAANRPGSQGRLAT